MRLIKRIVGYFRKHVYNSFYLKRLFKKNKSHIQKAALITNPDCIECGKNVRVLYGARIECYKKYANEQLSPKLILQDGVCIGPHFNGLISDSCTIGKDTIIAQNVTLVTGNHGINPESETPYQSQVLTTQPMRIGKNCWIGCNAVFVAGGGIGNNCVVGAGSIVNKQFPDNVIVAGVPARIIKEYDFESHKWIKVQTKTIDHYGSEVN